MAATLDLTVEYYHLPQRAGVMEKEFERRGLDWSIPRHQAALVLVDVWGEHYVASHVERTRGIVLERILPLVDACRRAGVCVVHAPSPDEGTGLRGRFARGLYHGHRSRRHRRWAGPVAGSDD